MASQELDMIVQQMIEHSSRESSELRKDKVLFEWRAKLVKEPYFFHQFQIDRIVRQVRYTLNSVDLQTTGSSASSTGLR